MRRLLILAALVVACSGCGGVISSVYIIQSQLALSGARAANAESLAPYEFTSAEAYLAKARESHSYADFEHSLRFARLASQRAGEARKKALDANKPLELPVQDSAPAQAPPAAQQEPQQPQPQQPLVQQPPVQQAPPPVVIPQPQERRPPLIIRKVPTQQTPGNQ